MEKLQITTEGIRKNLNKTNPHNAICEFIWNGFDADATIIKINTKKNALGGITEIVISDNGKGIDFREIKQKFTPFNESEKIKNNVKGVSHTLPHGRNGVGRLTFFRFATEAKWDIIYRESKECRKTYFIEISQEKLNEYNVNNDNLPSLSESDIGTTVTFSNVFGIEESQMINTIKSEFFWLIWIFCGRNYSIYFNDSLIDFEDVALESFDIDVNNSAGIAHEFTINVSLWKESLGKEYSKFYFFNSSGEEVYKKNTTLNKKSDKFFHSVRIQSSYFDNFAFDPPQDGQSSFVSTESDKEYKTLIEYITRFLIKKRKAYLKAASKEYINHLIDNNIYPEFKKNNMLDGYRKNQLDAIVEALYMAEPKIFMKLNTSQQKIFIRLLNTIMDSDDKDSLFKVIEEVIDLEDEERTSFAELLQHTTLSNIISTIKLIEDRIEAIQALKEIVFNKEFNAREVEHVQAIVERHFWLFGEQYHLLTYTEPDFEEALRRSCYFKEHENAKVTIDHEDVNKEMDIFMIKQDKTSGYFKNIVVELKRPSVTIGEKQLSQIKSYMRVIQSEDRFNSTNSEWYYYLIGNHFDSHGFIEGELESNKMHGEHGLAYKAKNHQIYVKTWSEVFEEWETRSQFLLEKLNFSKELWMKKHVSADHAVSEVAKNSASLDIFPVPIAK